jgi:splicing factor 3B subunit 1
MLLTAGNDANILPAPYSGRTALQAAAERGHIYVVEALLAAKADVEAPPSTHDGINPLKATAQGSSPQIELLLEEARLGKKIEGLPI